MKSVLVVDRRPDRSVRRSRNRVNLWENACLPKKPRAQQALSQGALGERPSVCPCLCDVGGVWLVLASTYSEADLAMPIEAFLLVLGAAFVHATWNALVKGDLDKLAVIKFMSGTQICVSLCLIPYVAMPAIDGWYRQVPP